MAEIDDTELATLRANAEAGQSAAAALEQAQQHLAERNEALLNATRTAHPDLPADLITGTTPQELADSVERATAIRQQVLDANPPPTTPTTPPPTTTVTAGAPPRGSATEAPPGVTGVARMQHALEQRKPAGG